MKIIKIIEARRYRNKITGQTCSMYGAFPGYDQWEVESCGFTWMMSDGTIGFGRQPAKTLDEAIQVMNEVNRKDEEYRKEWEKIYGKCKT